MQLILCKVVESFCSPTHNIVPHISWHALPCHRTTKKYADFPIMVISQLLLRKFWIQTWFCNCPQYLCLFQIALSTAQIYMIKERFWYIGLMFCFFPANLMSSTYTDKNYPFSRCTNKHSQLETFSQPYFSWTFSQIAFPIIVLPKDDHTDFAQEERLCLPYWTMIWAICVVVDASKCLDTLILEIFHNFGASSI